MFLRIFVLFTLLLCSISSATAVSDKDVSRFIAITAQGVYVLEDGGRDLVKYSISNLDLQIRVNLSNRASSIVATDTRVAVVGKQGKDTVITLYNGDTLTKLGDTSFELNRIVVPATEESSI